jgi:hypothetical protein
LEPDAEPVLGCIRDQVVQKFANSFTIAGADNPKEMEWT